MIPSELSLADELTSLRAAGYSTDFTATDAGLRCGTCGHTHDGRDAVIERTYRFEGTSDPDDESILLALACPECGARGVLIAPYGPDASATESDVITRLRSSPP